MNDRLRKKGDDPPEQGKSMNFIQQTSKLIASVKVGHGESQPWVSRMPVANNNLIGPSRYVLNESTQHSTLSQMENNGLQTDLHNQNSSHGLQKRKRTNEDSPTEETNGMGVENYSSGPPSKKRIISASKGTNNKDNGNNVGTYHDATSFSQTMDNNHTQTNKATNKSQRKIRPTRKPYQRSHGGNMMSSLPPLLPRSPITYAPPLGTDVMQQFSSYATPSTAGPAVPALNEVLSRPPINFAESQHRMPYQELVDPDDIDMTWTYTPPRNVVRRSQKQLPPKEIARRLAEENKGTDRKVLGEVKPLREGHGWAFKDDSHPEWTKCQFHHLIRDRFIREDASEHPAPDAEPAKGRHPEDITSRCTNQMHWTSDPNSVLDPKGRKLLTNDFQRNEYTVKNPPDWVLEDGSVVIDVNAHAVKWFDGIPKTISSEIEPWRMEGMRAFNSMMVSDIIARMPKYTQKKNGDMELLQQASAFTNRSIVWRDQNGLRSLKKGKARKPIEISDDEGEGPTEQKRLTRKPKKGQLKLDVVVKMENDSDDHFDFDEMPAFHQRPITRRRKRDGYEDANEHQSDEPAGKKQRTTMRTKANTRTSQRVKVINRLNTSNGFDDSDDDFDDFSNSDCANTLMGGNMGGKIGKPRVSNRTPNRQARPQPFGYDQNHLGGSLYGQDYPGIYEHTGLNTSNDVTPALLPNNYRLGIDQEKIGNAYSNTTRMIPNGTLIGANQGMNGNASAYSNSNPKVSHNTPLGINQPLRGNVDIYNDPSRNLLPKNNYSGINEGLQGIGNSYQNPCQTQLPNNHRLGINQGVQDNIFLNLTDPRLPHNNFSGLDCGKNGNTHTYPNPENSAQVPTGMGTGADNTSTEPYYFNPFDDPSFYMNDQPEMLGAGDNSFQLLSESEQQNTSASNQTTDALPGESSHDPLDFRTWVPHTEEEQQCITEALVPTLDAYKKYHPEVAFPNLDGKSYKQAVRAIRNLGTELHLPGIEEQHPMLIRKPNFQGFAELKNAGLHWKVLKEDGEIDKAQN